MTTRRSGSSPASRRRASRPPPGDAGGGLSGRRRVLLRLGLGRDALAERVALVLVGAVLLLERGRVELALVLALLGGVHGRRLIGLVGGLGQRGDALAVGV